MRTIGDVHRELARELHSDLDRALSEHGIALGEVSTYLEGVFLIEAPDGVAEDQLAMMIPQVRELLDRVFSEGVVVGIHIERERRDR